MPNAVPVASAYTLPPTWMPKLPAYPPVAPDVMLASMLVASPPLAITLTLPPIG